MYIWGLHETGEREEQANPSVRWADAAELSVKQGDVGKLCELLRREEDGANAGRKDMDGTNELDPAALETLLMELDPVHTACAEGHREMVRFILTEVAPCRIQMYDKSGATALHTCARFGRLEIARDLLGYGAVVHSHDRGECTPLHIACEHDNGAVVRLLLDAGSRVNERDKNGCTPLFTSVRTGGSPATLHLLLEKGAEVDGTPDGEPTALALASGMGCLTTVRLLAGAGADLLAAAANVGGETALHLAAHNGSESVLCFLLAAGCWAETKDVDGRTPLASACAGGRTGTAKVLLTGHGWSLNHVPEDVPPDLRRHVLSFLVAAPNTRDSNGNTPLLTACEHRGTIGVLDLLAAHGADFALTNNSGETPLHVACRRGNAGLANYLLGCETLPSSSAAAVAAGSTSSTHFNCCSASVDAKDSRGRRPGEVRDIDVSHDEALAVREVVGRESVCPAED